MIRPEELLQRQAELQAETDVVSNDLRLDERLGRLGTPARVGSAALGLMVRRDLDITVSCRKLDAVTLETITQVGAMLTGHPQVRQVELRNDTGAWNADPRYPDGFYLGVGYRSVQGRDWSIDLWFVDEPERQPDLAHARAMPARLSTECRIAILSIKQDLLERSAYGNTCGYDVYRSVLDDGVRTPGEFEQWRAREQVDRDGWRRS